MRKTNRQIAEEVIQGKWGNGSERKQKLTKAGYNYNTIQKLVNSILDKQTTRKNDNEIADEVIAGLWGNGITRRTKLTQAGYNYKEIQRLVNAKLNSTKSNSDNGDNKMAWWARTWAPETSNKYWINVNYGGFNKCIVIDSSTGSVLPNCTGYVHGRWMEIGGVTTEYNLSLGNASTYWGYNDGYSRGSEPQLGAIACYGNGAGHVAVVEEIVSSDEIVCSESDYGGSRFVIRHRYRQYGWKPSANWGTRVFQGFIYHPALDSSGDGGSDEPTEKGDDVDPDTGGAGDSQTGGPTTAPEGSNINLYVVAAICGNWWYESGMNPGIWESLETQSSYQVIGHGYGLGQWTNVGTATGRLYHLYEFMINNGYAMNDGDAQCEYLIEEDYWTIKSDYSQFSSLSDFLSSDSTNITELTHAFNYCWEGIKDGTWNSRVSQAQLCYNYILEHWNDSDITEWKTGNRYLSTSERYNNCVMLWRYLSKLYGSGSPYKIAKKSKVWMWLRNPWLYRNYIL